jgi:hypothetical protein
MYRYEAITKNNLGKNKRTTMLLTSPWVKQNFDKEYLEKHQKLQDLMDGLTSKILKPIQH